MLKFLTVALVFAVCNCQQIVSLNGLNGIQGLNGLNIDGNTQYVLVPVNGVQRQAVIRQAVQPITRVITAPQVYSTPRVAIAAPKIAIAAPRPVVYQAPHKVIVRGDEHYGPPEPYTFGFQSTDEQGNTLSRSETADGSGAVKGSYSYTDIDGLIRVVEYIADAAGYRASVRTNEPGTANANPADVQINAEEVPSNVQQKVAAYSVPKQRIH